MPNIVRVIRRRFNFLPRLWNKAKGGIFFYCRATTLAVPGLTSLQICEGKMDKLIEFKFLITIDAKNIRLICASQNAVSLTYSCSETVTVGMLRVKAVVFMFFINEHKFFAIISSDIEVHQPSWGLCIRFSMIPITVLFCFRIGKVFDVKGRQTGLE